MIRDPDANGLPLRILQAARNFPRRLEDEGIGPRRVGLQQAIAPVLDVGEGGNLGQVPAHEREIVVLAGLPDLLQASGGLAIAEVPAKRIAGIRGVNDQAVAAEHLHGLLDQAALGIHGMDVKALGHARILTAHLRQPGWRLVAYHAEPNPDDGPIMHALVDLLPLLAFGLAYLVAYLLTDLHTAMRVAILVIMVAISLQVLVTWLVKRTVSRMLLASAALVVVLGAISLQLNNPVFFKWKPTVLYWVFAAVIFGSRYLGDRPIVQRIIESAAKDEFRLSQADWRRLNLMWVLFFVVLGAANIFVAYRFSEPVWVSFKLFGLTGMMLLFALLQAFWLSKRTPDET